MMVSFVFKNYFLGASIATNGKAAIVSQCGQGKGLITADDGASVTVCCKFFCYHDTLTLFLNVNLFVPPLAPIHD